MSKKKENLIERLRNDDYWGEYSPEAADLLEEIVQYHRTVLDEKYPPEHEGEWANGTRDASSGFLKWLDEKLEAVE